MRRLSIAVVVLLLLTSCYSRMDETPAAEVSENPGSSTSPATSTLQPTSVGQIIKEKSSIGFIGAKVTGEHVGTFHQFDGRIEYVGSQPTAIDFTINPASVKTDAAKLDAHLKSPDFFDVAKYPTATFRTISITPAPAGDPEGTHRITGTFNLHGVAKEITFPARVALTPGGIHATSAFKINRHGWGISYRGDDLIKDHVAIQLDLWFPPPPAA